jgi:hypothetical protein
MTTPTRSIRPKCPECGFSIFNRRFAKCESCGALLPTSIVYSHEELAIFREQERIQEEAKQKARTRQQASNDSGVGFAGGGDWGGTSDGDGGGGDGY